MKGVECRVCAMLVHSKHGTYSVLKNGTLTCREMSGVLAHLTLEEGVDRDLGHFSGCSSLSLSLGREGVQVGSKKRVLFTLI